MSNAESTNIVEILKPFKPSYTNVPRLTKRRKNKLSKLFDNQNAVELS